MERLKSSIPDELAERISTSQTSDLFSTCAALACHVKNCAFFPQLLEQLTNPRLASSSKDEQTALKWKEDGNFAYCASDYPKALSCYTQALRYSPWGPDAKQKNGVATVLVNRATCLHKLSMLDAAVRDCTRAIELFPAYAKAWYRRGIIRSEQAKFMEAKADMREALVYESSAGGRKHIEKQLELVRADFATTAADKIPSVEPNVLTDGVERGWLAPTLAQSTRTSDKGAGLQTVEELAAGSLVLSEQPYAAIVLKARRETHCHFCFAKLPADTVACRGCTVAVYCSDTCRDIAAGYSCSVSGNHDGVGQRQGGEDRALNREHHHECGGSSWSAVLPTEAVLAARAYVRSLASHEDSATPATPAQNLCHHYDNSTRSDKLDILVLALVVAHCLKYSPTMKKELSVENIVVELVLLIARVRVNVMAIYEITSTSSNTGNDEEADMDCLHSVNQVSVAHGLYLKGSMFNHSCDPNVHAYFSSRQLLVNSIKTISAFAALELSYGAQVGELDRSARQKWLKERYFFTCACQACSSTTYSDLVINALRCQRPDCDGTVTGLDILQFGKSRCLSCASIQDTTKYRIAVEDAFDALERIGEGLAYQVDADGVPLQLRKALKRLGKLKLVAHHCSKQLAKAQDVMAKIYCLVGKPEIAISYCEASVRTLDLLYGEGHIAVANERLKLASIAMVAGETEFAKTQLAQVQRVLRVHYGAAYENRYPAVTKMWRQLAQRTP